MTPDDLIVTADITNATVQDGEVRVTVGDATSGAGFGAVCSMWSQDGFISCPNLPTSGTGNDGACQCIYVQDGNEKKVIGTRDHRYQEQTGNIEAGDRAIVTSGAAKVVVKNRTATVTLATTDDGTPAGNVSTVSNAPDEIALVSKYGSIIIDKDGIFITHVGGALVALTAALLPTPMSTVRIVASRCQIDARAQIGLTAASGGTGVFMAPVVAPVASPQPEVPVPVAEGVGVALGITANNVTFS
jgi:hypothetical protein